MPVNKPKTKPRTVSERQQALRDRRQQAGYIRREYWATESEHALLRQALESEREKKSK